MGYDENPRLIDSYIDLLETALEAVQENARHYVYLEHAEDLPRLQRTMYRVLASASIFTDKYNGRFAMLRDCVSIGIDHKLCALAIWPKKSVVITTGVMSLQQLMRTLDTLAPERELLVMEFRHEDRTPEQYVMMFESKGWRATVESLSDANVVRVGLQRIVQELKLKREVDAEPTHKRSLFDAISDPKIARDAELVVQDVKKIEAQMQADRDTEQAERTARQARLDRDAEDALSQREENP